MIIVKKKICIFSTLFMSMFFLTENVFARSFQCDALEGVVFDEQVPHIIKYVLLIIQILVPIFLVIFGSIDLFKGVYAQKEDEIKKGQQIFIKRLIAGVLVFFVIAIVIIVAYLWLVLKERKLSIISFMISMVLSLFLDKKLTSFFKNNI